MREMGEHKNPWFNKVCNFQISLSGWCLVKTARLDW